MKLKFPLRYYSFTTVPKEFNKDSDKQKFPIFHERSEV